MFGNMREFNKYISFSLKLFYQLLMYIDSMWSLGCGVVGVGCVDLIHHLNTCGWSMQWATKGDSNSALSRTFSTQQVIAHESP